MKTKKLVYCALFAAIISVASQISVPVQPIPINAGLFAVLLCGGMLGKKYGTISVVVYILLGIIGAPVFAGFRGGLGVLAGPTGGYVFGYAIVAFVTGMVCENTKKVKYTIPFMMLSVVLCYIVGTMWFCITTGNDFVSALSMCVIPFIPWDILKVVLASMVIKRYIK
ncbi:MAG: biotin transporter BioY [Clostridia bacterium]|nr:biotin transporter BioY [Clostridia bacterium]